MGNTKANDVIDSFESSFQDKVEIPTELEMFGYGRQLADIQRELVN